MTLVDSERPLLDRIGLLHRDANQRPDADY